MLSQWREGLKSLAGAKRPGDERQPQSPPLPVLWTSRQQRGISIPRPAIPRRRLYSLCGIGFWLALFVVIVPVHALDRAGAYRSALPLYHYNARQPLTVQVQAKTPFFTGQLLHFSYASANGQRVPALLFVPKGADKAHPVPCLIALHGLGGSKEFMMGFAPQFALPLGYAVLAIDEYGQGDRPRPPTSGAGVDVPALTSGIRQTVIDVRRGLDYLKTRPEINQAHIGLIGLSLGAIIGTVSAGVDPRIRAAVLISGGGDWGLILQSLADRNATIAGHTMGSLRGTDWDLVRAFLAAEDPLTFAAHIAPRPLLMENGGADTIIAPAAAQLLYAAANGAPGARVHQDIYPGIGHFPPPELIYPKIRQWLAKNL